MPVPSEYYEFSQKVDDNTVFKLPVPEDPVADELYRDIRNTINKAVFDDGFNLDTFISAFTTTTPIRTILNIMLYHDSIDPEQFDTLKSFARSYAKAIGRRASGQLLVDTDDSQPYSELVTSLHSLKKMFAKDRTESTNAYASRHVGPPLGNSGPAPEFHDGGSKLKFSIGVVDMLILRSI